MVFSSKGAPSPGPGLVTSLSRQGAEPLPSSKPGAPLTLYSWGMAPPGVVQWDSPDKGPGTEYAQWVTGIHEMELRLGLNGEEHRQVKTKVSVAGTGQRWPGKERWLRVEVAGERSDKVSVTGAQTPVGLPARPSCLCALLRALFGKRKQPISALPPAGGTFHADSP